MAKVRLMYWKEVPVQVQAVGDDGQVSEQLDARFQEGVDAISMMDGSAGTDDYLAGWAWGEFDEVEGAAAEVASQVAERYNRGFPDDFVKRIRDLRNSDMRDPRPGAADSWLE